ncbi:SRPBCC domain-containing protein [Rhizobium wenxiniae]|uniref:SRPBCC domain-containing protein n=1 Tax=Rhizobium wenxiniae TaxID=1737357 RepID=UPI001C6E16AF|nr:SRPBCC domain-containing protein [Rhizobium wenxiniae]MBW9086610.1 SRPBCC domain-containing protein [Rhizobium wenxiniae]
MTDAVNRSLIIENERIFATDRATLFRAFSDPRLLEKWWGPHGFTNRVERFDFVNGGTWVIVMTSSSDTDFKNHWTFEEIRQDERIAAFHHGPKHAFGLEIGYHDDAEGTRLTWRMSFEDTEQNREIEKFLSAANEQNFDRLEAVLTSVATTFRSPR